MLNNVQWRAVCASVKGRYPEGQDALRLIAAAYRIDLDRWNRNFGHGQSAPE